MDEAKAEQKKDTEELEDLEKPKGSATPIIIGVVAAVVIIGGYCCYKKNSDSESEGGNKEDKKLFKKVFKGKTQKKAAKEEIIPTFAVPTEEQV